MGTLILVGFEDRIAVGEKFIGNVALETFGEGGGIALKLLEKPDAAQLVI
tara:strand:+ start:265 stop:414 length:150 start_codon:yes stop_codon:yes gene_type:complete